MALGLRRCSSCTIMVLRRVYTYTCRSTSFI